MQLTIHLNDGDGIEEILVDNFKELSYFNMTRKTLTTDLSTLIISDSTTYNFKGDAQVSLNGSEISYIELSYS